MLLSPVRWTSALLVLCWLSPLGADCSHADAQYGGYGGYGSSAQASYESDSVERGNRLRRGKLFQPAYEADGDYRQPRSLALWRHDRALISTRLTGQIFCADLLNQLIEPVITDGERQFDSLLVIDDQRLLVIDTKNDEVVEYRWSDDQRQWHQAAVIAVSGRPHSLHYDEQQQRLWVSSSWGQRLHCFQSAFPTDAAPVDRSASGPTATSPPEGVWSTVAIIDLPMCGGRLLGLPHQGLIMVADAFGHQYAMIDSEQMKVVQHQSLYEHNVSDLVTLDDGQTILFAHQLLHDVVPAVQNHITWGTFISNSLRMVKTEAMLSGQGKEIYRGSRFIPVGEVRNGAGDPTSIALGPDNRIAVTAGGTSQVAIGTLGDVRFEMIDVGARPVDSVFSADGKSLLVISQFSDSLSIIDWESRQATHLTLGKVRPPTNLERGEQLFHDATLSHDGWMSCQSCHTDGHTTGLLADNFTDDSYDSPKRVLSLLGQAHTAPYSWTGQLAELEQQVVVSIESTMASDHPAQDSDVRQLSQFIRSLPPPPSVYHARPDAYAAAFHQVEAGGQVFVRAGCADCHSGSMFTSDGAYDVGLVDENGHNLFNPPSLLGVSQRQNALFHDASARSIRDVVVNQRHQLPDDVTGEQAEALVHYLKSL